jgi:phage tail-like protein
MATGKYHKYAFKVEIDGFDIASFKTCSDLKGTRDTIEDTEGGSDITYKDTGRKKYDDITLTRGVSDNQDLNDWWESGDERDCSIVQTNKAGEEVARWDVDNAKPNEFVAGSWDADASELTIESIKFCHEGFKRVK